MSERPSSLPNASCGFGDQLIESTALPEQIMNQLFAALLLTAAGVFVAANLLLMDLPTLFSSARITAACFGMLLIFYMLSRQTGNLLWGLALTCGAAWLAVFSRQLWLMPFVLRAVSVGTLLYALKFLRVRRNELLPLLLMAAVAAAAIAGMESYTSFDILPRLHNGEVHQDTLYHASIAAMIKNYGVVSTGLHGLVETPYHVFSHVLMAFLSLLSGAGVLEVYGVANQVLFAPLLIFSITACCVQLDHSRKLLLPLLWGTVVMLLAVLPVLFGWWVILQRPFFISESYVLSLSLFTLGLVLLYKRHLTWSDLLLTLLLSGMIANAKASTGLFFAGLWLARLLLVRGSNARRDAAAAFLAAAATGWVVFASAQANANTAMSFEPFFLARRFSFLSKHLDAAMTALHSGLDIPLQTALLAAVALISFIIFHFFISWIVISATVRRCGMKGVLRTSLGVYSSASLLAGLLAFCLLNIADSSVFYFSNVALFTSLSGAVVLLTSWMQHYLLPQKLLFILLLTVICCLEWNGFLNNSAALHRRYTDCSKNKLISHLSALRSSSPAHLVLRPSLDDVAGNPAKCCAATSFVFPKAPARSWSTCCMVKPFLFPAVSERAWTGVLEENCTYAGYGYSLYGFSNSQPQKISIPPVLLPGMNLQN